MRRAALALTLSLVLFGSRAQAGDTGSAGAATQLFDEGIALMDKGKFAEACPKLAKSQQLAPNGGTLLALADCYEKNGQVASAWVALKEAADRAGAAKRADVERTALEGAKRLEPKISKLTVEVPSKAAIDGLVLKRDGKPMNQAEYGLAVPLDPGTHTIEASAPGHKPWTSSVTFNTQAATKTLTVPLLDVDPNARTETTAPPAEEASTGRTQRVIGVALAGVGVVGLGLGGFFGLRASSKNDDAASHCRDTTHCDQQGLDLDKQAHDAATISTIAFIAGGTALVGGAVLFFTAPKSQVAVGVRGTSVTVAAEF
jgi:hypothetical protein